ncbi:MAG TPA: N-acetyltransferase [Micromonosporaceae bacterium]|nr:N-acetyltransferase [Micromonosporaceae bacterium]
MTVTIRTQRAGELDVVRDVSVRAFRDEVIGDLVVALQQAPAGAAGRFYVAESDDGRVVGSTMLTRSWVDAPTRLLEVLVLSPLAVLPDHQGQGIGGRLVTHALREAEAAAPLVFLEGDPAYYARFGFRAAGPLGFTKPSVRIPDVAFQVVTLPGHEPWMTGALVYAEQFWSFDCVGLRSPDPSANPAT